jgi:hypothetical protein
MRLFSTGRILKNPSSVLSQKFVKEVSPSAEGRNNVAHGDRACVNPWHDGVIDPGWDPITRPAPADEDAVAGHPLPQRGEGRVITQIPAGLNAEHLKSPT